MIVVVVSDCPPRLRGDLTKWLVEINTGVYVGNLNARVREELWQRICENLKNGQASMVYSTNNEQKMDFKVHNTTWEPVDFDGLKLMRRPINLRKSLSENSRIPVQNQASKAANYQKARKCEAARLKKSSELEDYCVVDLETTGLDSSEDEIIEIGALCIRGGKIVKEYQVLVQSAKEIPKEIEELTQITSNEIKENGIDLAEAIKQLTAFVGNDVIIGHNVSFEQEFLLYACKKCNLPPIRNKLMDTLRLAKRKLKSMRNHKLNTIAEYYGIKIEDRHRALQDCYLTFEVYEKLKEN